MSRGKDLACAGACAALLAGLAGRASAESRHFLEVEGGLAFTSTYQKNGSDVSGTGSGGYGGAQYRYRLFDWLSPRLYTGVFIAPAQSDCGAGVVPCDVSAKVFLLGGKVHVMAPIPYVGPFVEVGIGASAGTMSTRVGGVFNHTMNGVTYHIPFAVGLAIGSQHQYEIALQYLLYPAEEQTCGAFAIGFGFPLG